MPIIYRANALNAISQIEETYPPLNIIRPSAWIWLIFAITTLMCFILWGTFGAIETSVDSTGMIIPRNSQVISILALSGGVVTAVSVQGDQDVKAGDSLAKIANPYLDEDVEYLNKLYVDNEAFYMSHQVQYQAKKNWLNEQYKLQTNSIIESEKNAQNKLSIMNSIYQKKLGLYKKQYLTILDIEKSKEESVIANEALTKLQMEVKEMPVKFSEAKMQLDEQMNLTKNKYLSSKHDLELKLLEKRKGSDIQSPVDGKILGVNIAKGNTINENELVFNILSKNKTDDLQALVFVGHQEGKKINKGNHVYILPSQFTAYQFGYIQGRVEEISEYPASKPAVLAYVGNASLVDEYFALGAPFVVKVKLEKNSKNLSGLSWTSRKGYKGLIKPGSPVSARIVVKNCSLWQLLAV